MPILRNVDELTRAVACFGSALSSPEHNERAVPKLRLSELKGILKLKEPKSARSRRRVDLPQTAVTALHEHRKRIVAEGNAGSP